MSEMKTYNIVVEGANPYVPVKKVMEQFGMSAATLSRYLNEMKDCGRYKRHRPVINECGMNSHRLVNMLAFIDFLDVRGKLREDSIAKNLPPFDPSEIRKECLGEYKIPLMVGEAAYISAGGGKNAV